MLDISRQKIAESERDSAEQRLRYQALHDGLTGLPNRVSFLADADAAIRDVLANGSRLELVIMDLDHFKEVNDTLGHANGDILLQEVAVRIADALGPGDFCARLGGDEFAIVIRDASPEASGKLLAEISESLESTIELEGFPVNIEASLGIARLPEDGTSLEELMRRADWAMYQSKHGRSMIASGNVSGSASRELSDDFRRAVAGGGLTLHYQPKLDLHTLRLDGVEALVRWPHPERGLIYPEELIPLAERANLVRPLTLFVIGEALRQCRAWLDHGREVPVSVNLWMRNLIDAALPARIRELLDHHGVPARMLKLEMSETAFVSDPLRIAAVLEQLGDLGVQFSVARFGAGYSSLSSLHRLPITEVKIDRGLIAGLQAGEADESVLRAAIGLGRDLGFRVVAEGVETDEMVTRLGALGSDSVQGFVVSVPLPPGELEAWLDERFGGSGPRVVV
jgi:diguanylate cyclase (GGDEF)-like protein